MSVDQMEQFLDLVKAGKNSDGSKNNIMTTYNQAVIKDLKGAPLNLTRAQKIKYGKAYADTEMFLSRGYIKNPATRRIFLATLGTLLAIAPSGQAYIESAVDDKDFQQGFAALSRGDKESADKHFFGEGGAEHGVGGYYLTLAAAAGGPAAQGLSTAEAFRQAYLAATKDPENAIKADVQELQFPTTKGPMFKYQRGEKVTGATQNGFAYTNVEVEALKNKGGYWMTGGSGGAITMSIEGAHIETPGIYKIAVRIVLEYGSKRGVLRQRRRSRF